jgi:hypothetical protein
MSDEQIKEEDERHRLRIDAALKKKGYERVEVEVAQSSESSESSDSEDDTEEESVVAVDWWELDRKRKEEELLAKRIEEKVKEGTGESAPAPKPGSISEKGLENLIALSQGKPEPHVTFPEEPPLPPVQVVPLVVARPRALVSDARGVKRWVRIKQSGRAKNA